MFSFYQFFLLLGLFIYLFLNKLYTQQAWTHNPEIRRRMLHPLSHPSTPVLFPGS